jgi:hypothetical protein
MSEFRLKLIQVFECGFISTVILSFFRRLSTFSTIRAQLSFFSFFLVLSASFGSMNLPITIRESAGVSAATFPVTVIVPLPYGLYQDCMVFRLTDADGREIRAQFRVLNRHWAKDNSIRHLQVDFLSSVSANGSTTYYLHDDGQGSSPAGTLSVSSDESHVTVDTGSVFFRIDKNNFNLFDLVQKGGKTLLDSADTEGGVWHDRFGSVQYMAGGPAPEITVEESGPVRAVLRIEQGAYFRPSGQYSGLQPGLDNLTNPLAQGDYIHQPGYCVRIYAWEGLDYVQVEYALVNGDKTVLQAWPFYFRDFSLSFNLPSEWESVSFGTGEDYNRENGKYLYQKRHDIYEVKDSAAQTVLSSGSRAEGWFNASDGSSAGMMVAVKDFWQRWPNAFELDGNGRFYSHFFPPYGQDYFFNSSLYKMQETTTGLYWLDDMQMVGKTLLFYFHDGLKTATDFSDLNRLFQKRPVPVLPVDWYAETAVTLDMGGLFPVSQLIASPDNTDIDSWTGFDDISHGLYSYGYDTYRADVGRRAAWTTGSWPRSAANFLLSANPKYFYKWEAMVTGDMNARPQHLPGFIYPDDMIDGYSPITEHPYTTYSWRYWKFNHGHPKIFAPYLAGTAYSGFSPRDTAHMWNYYIEDYYYFTGDKRLYDWYLFMGNFCLANIYGDKSYPGVLVNPNERVQLRGMGHLLSTLMQAYRVTGKAEFLSGARDFLTRIRSNQCKYGFISSAVYMASAFQLAYLLRGIISLAEEIGNTDPDFFAFALGVIEGFVAWNYHYGDFEYYIDNDLMVSFHSRGKITSSGTAFILLDPICWYYHHTGEFKYINHIRQYMRGELGDVPIQPSPGSLTDWQGDFAGRWSHYVLSDNYQRSADIPAAITDLRAEQNGEKTFTLNWTGPIDAAYFHVRWSDRPISGEQTAADALCNWWQAELVTAKTGGSGSQSLSFSLENIPLNGILYFAVKTFNHHSNISSLSNVAVLPVGAGDLVAPNRVTDMVVQRVTENTATLEWLVPGDDGEYGTASTYDIRISNQPLTDENWAQAQTVPVAFPARNVESSYPKTQSLTISGLEMGIPYYAGMKSGDDAGNISDLSNIVYFMPREADKISPSAVTNLGIRSSGLFGVELEWTAPGDDGMTGQASVYDLRFTSSSFDWQTAEKALEIPSPEPAESLETFIVKKLLSDTAYIFALKTADAAGNWSDLSNIVNFTTGKIDQSPPAPVLDLRVVNTGDTFVELAWTATGDDGMTGLALRYEMACAESLISQEQWQSVSKVANLTQPQQPGTTQNFRVENLRRSTDYFFVLRVVDHAFSYSEFSNQVQVKTEDSPSIATGKPVTSNSQLHGNYLTNLVDGTLNNPWVSDYSPDGIWAEVDLQDFYDLSGADMIPLYNYSAYGHGLEVSADRLNWRRVGACTPGAVPGRISHVFTAENVCYVRLMIEDQAHTQRVYISELKLYGEPSESDNVLSISEGWNLISLPLVPEPGWNWPVQIQECHAYQGNDQWLNGGAEPGTGYFCYSSAAVSLSLSGDVFTPDFSNLHSGWHLLGSSKIISLPEFMQANPAVQLLWTYENGSWYYYARRFLDDQRLKAAGYKKIIYIRPSAAFWVKI